MSMGAWRRWADHPSPEELPARMTDRSARLWTSLTGWLRATYGLDGELAWTDEDSGWVLRYRRDGRSLVTLFPTASGGFDALIVLGPALWGAVHELALGEATWEAFTFATAYADGRWLWLRVTGPETMGDIRRLVMLKAPPPGRTRTSGEDALERRVRELEREREVSGIR